MTTYPIAARTGRFCQLTNLPGYFVEEELRQGCRDCGRQRLAVVHLAPRPGLADVGRYAVRCPACVPLRKGETILGDVVLGEVPSHA